jgi:hypothetical protein
MSTTDTIVESLTQSPTVAELEAATRVSLPDLIRFGSEQTIQEFGWGQGEKACALSAAALGLEALRRK